MFYDALWILERMVRCVGCFFVGHDVISGERWLQEDDWCLKCWVDWPQDKITLPDLLTGLVGWLVESECQWFERLDAYIWENHRERLPDWWEY